MIALVLFAVTLAGAFGFYIENRAPWLGAALVVAGGVAISLVVFWLVFPIVSGVDVRSPRAASVQTHRSRRFSHSSNCGPVYGAAMCWPTRRVIFCHRQLDVIDR